jgi:V8-like Glu-specific endopeptidase
LVNSVACEPPPRASEATAASQEAIQGGQVEAGYPAVGGLGNSIDDDGFGCTGTLIAPTLVLSAKHCGAL